MKPRTLSVRGMNGLDLIRSIPSRTSCSRSEKACARHLGLSPAEGRVKVRNLRRDPRVGLSVVDRDNPYWVPPVGEDQTLAS